MPTVDHTVLRRLLTDVYEASGLPRESAEIVSTHQVDANLVGHDSHGVIRTPDYVALLERGHVVADAEITVERETPSSAVIDANWGMGFPSTQRAVDLAIDKATETGVAAVTIKRQGHIGRLGAYSARAAERGMIGLVTADSGRAPKAVAPLGGREPRLGTNPLSIAVPSASHGPIVLDMATSTVAGGKVKLARSRGERLPAGWILDREGRPSRDPEDFVEGGALLPLGADQAHKGYGLSFMVEVLSGLLTGIGFGVDPDGIHNDGAFVAVFAVDRFRPLEEFAGEVSEFVAHLKATPLAEGYEEILYPGEPEARTAQRRRREGIYVEDATWGALTALAERLGVTVDAS